MAVLPTVVASSQTKYATGMTDATKVVIDASGNLYTVDSGKGSLVEIPAGTTTPVTILTGLGGPHGLAVDSYGDVIVSGSYNYHIYFLQNQNGTLCVTCNAAGTGPLDLTSANSMSTYTDYYGATSDIAVDPNGLVYVSYSSCNSSGTNACGTSHNTIVTVKTQGPTTTAKTIGVAGTVSQFIGTLPSAAGLYAQNIAVDGAGHFYYADSKNVYASSTTNPAPVVIGSGFTAPYGVSVDAAGDLFVSDNGTRLLYEIPNENGTLNPAHQFAVAAPPNIEYGVAIDPAGSIYSADGYGSGSIDKTTFGALAVGSAAVAATTASGTVTFVFNASVTPTAIGILQGSGAATEFKNTFGGSCAAKAYTALQTCTVQVTLTPSSTGLRKGAVVLLGAGNKALSTAHLWGTGTGPALTIDPGTQTAMTAQTQWTTPSSVALDAAGNIYTADSGGNFVQVNSPSGAVVATLAGGFSAPSGVAVDGAGNVYVVNTAGSSGTGTVNVVEVPNEGGTLNVADETIIATGLKAPTGIAVDPYGAVYVADTGNTRVLRFSTFDGLGSVSQTTVGKGYVSPVGLAVDGNGNVYVADEGANQIDLVNIYSGAQSIALPNLSSPTSVALDASGSLYVVNSSGGTVLRVPNVGGALLPAQALSLGVNLATPIAVAVNGSGAVAIADDGAAASGTAGQPGYLAAVPPTSYSLVRTGGTLNFGNVNIGLSSSPQAITLTSAGTSSATLGATAYTQTGTTADFSVTSPNSGGCSNNLALAVGTTCVLNAVLTPLVNSGTLTETINFSDNAVNGATSEVLTGVATNLSLTTTTLALTSSTTPVYGQAISVQAAVVSQRSGYTPTGFVTFYLDGAKQKPAVALSGSSPYIAPFTFAGLKLSAGIHAINACYAGDTNNAASCATTAVTLTVTQQASATAVTPSAVLVSLPTVPPTVVAQVPGSTFYFYVTVSPTLSGAPTGTVSLVAAGSTPPYTALATATLNTLNQAVLSYAPPATGSYQIVYGGDSNYVGSISAATTVQIRTPTYDVSIPNTSYTVTGGGSLSVPMSITGISGYTGNVTMTGLNLVTGAVTAGCSGLPAYVTCTFSPGIVSLTNGNYPSSNPTGTINLTLTTNVPPSTQYPLTSRIAWPGAVVALLILFLPMKKRRGMLGRALPALLLFAGLGLMAVGVSGCGSGSSAYATPKGTSTVTLNFSGTPLGGVNSAVTAANPDIPNTATFQLTVQ